MRAIRLLGFLVLVLLGASPSWAQTTGSLAGRVSDESGAPLPGVAVEVRGPALQGARTATSDAAGAYRFTLLPPGEYKATFTLTGFNPVAREGVRVSLGQDGRLDMQMKVGTREEQVTVTAEAAAIDHTTSAIGHNLDSRSIQTLPTGRNYSSVVQVTPGVASDANPENRDQTSITVYGSSGAENVFLIDGVNTTNVEYGFQGKELNFEFIQEISVRAGGYEAEYGKATGGIINVITKSGGNQFSGDLFGYFDDDSLQREAKTVVSTGGTAAGFRKADFGADLGGPILKDRLWFFAAYDHVQNTTDTALPSGPAAGQIVESKSERDLASAKLTYSLGSGQSLVATFFQDPRSDTGAISDGFHALNGTSSTYEGKREFGGRDFALRYDGALSGNWVLSAQVARHAEENSVGPAGAAGEGIQQRDAANDFFQTGGFGRIEEKEFKRDMIEASAMRLFGDHQVKVGVEYEVEKADVFKRYSGGQQVDVFANTVNPARPIYRHFYWTTPTATLSNAPTATLEAPTKHKGTSAYLQDRWQPRPNLTVNLGVRWDRQQIIDSSGVQQIDLKKDFAPRLGVTWDPKGDGRSKVYGSYGRYYEDIPMDLVIRSFSSERQPRIVNYDPVSIVPNAQAEADFGTDSAILGGFSSIPDPDIKNQYLHEGIVGFERELRPGWAVGVKGIYRKYGEVIEDFLCTTEGDYCIGNPGKGLFANSIGLDYESVFPAPRARRSYKGVQVDVTKRFSDNWQGIASYVLSKLEGNFDGEFAPFTNVGADPNISAAYDYFDFFTDGRDLTRITNTGDLSNDRRHQLKLSGFYQAPFKLSVGLSTYFRTGTPFNRMGYSDAYGRYEFFLRERGAEGRQPSVFEADLHLGYPIDVGKRGKLNLLLDVFSLFNAQRAILLDQRYSFQESDNFNATSANPGFRQAAVRTAPTTVRLGVRLSF